MENAKRGSVVISHTTGNVSTLQGLVEVSGRTDDSRRPDQVPPGHAKGVLTVLLGGPEAAVKQAESVVLAYSKEVIRTGDPVPRSIRSWSTTSCSRPTPNSPPRQWNSVPNWVSSRRICSTIGHCSGRSAVGAF